MRDVIATTIAVISDQYPDGYMPLSFFKRQKATHPRRKVLQRVNIVLRQICAGFPKARLILASALVRRPIQSTYDLTVGEAYGLLRLADDPEFILFATQLVEDIDYELEEPVRPFRES